MLHACATVRKLTLPPTMSNCGMEHYTPRVLGDSTEVVGQEAMRGDQTVQAIAARHGINPNQLSRWQTEAYDGLLEVLG